MRKAFFEERDSLFRKLDQEVEWEMHMDAIDNDMILEMPRLISYQANDPSFVYSYPGITKPLVPKGHFSETVDMIRKQIEQLMMDADEGLAREMHAYTDMSKSSKTQRSDGADVGVCASPPFFNSAHLNLYRSGKDHVSWHTDEDVSLYGASPIIASVSFGASRDFILRRMNGDPYHWSPLSQERRLETPTMVKIELNGGDLLVMRGATQRHYEHCVRKSATSEGAKGPRVNITFRRIVRETI